MTRHALLSYASKTISALGFVSLLVAIPSTAVAGEFPDLALVKEDHVPIVEPGDVFFYQLTYENNGDLAPNIRIFDTIPEGTTFDAAGSTPGWSCAHGAPAGTACEISIPDLPPNDPGDAVVISLRVDPALPAGFDLIENTGEIRWFIDEGLPGHEDNLDDNVSTHTTPVDVSGIAPDLVLGKDDGGITAAPGDTVSYQLTYANAGTRGATGAEISDTVPIFSTFDATASSAGWSCADGAPAATECLFSVGTLQPGDGAAITFGVRVDPTLPPGAQQLENQASISDDGANGADLDPSNNTAFDTTPFGGPGDGPDLAITKDDGGVFAVEGEVITYELLWVNAGTTTASGVGLVDTVPEHTTFDAAGSNGNWTCLDGDPPGTVCRFGDQTLEPGEDGRTLFAVRVDAEVPPEVLAIENTVTISDDGTHGPDTSPDDNVATETTPFPRPDLEVTKDDGGGPAAPGDVVSYAIDYANAGDDGASGVEVVDTVPAFTTFDAGASTAGWTCADGAPAGSPCSLPVGTLPAGAAGGATFAVEVDSTLPPGVQQIENQVAISDDGTNGPDLDPSNNLATDTTPIDGPGAGPDLTVTKDDGGVNAEPGEIVTYQLAYSNLGPRGATGVELTEVVPDHSTFEPGASSPGWSCVGLAPPAAGLKPERVQRSLGGVSCTLPVGTLVAGDGGSAAFAVRVADPMPGGVTEIANVVSITDDGTNGPDIDLGNNSSTDTTPLESGPGTGLDATAIDTPLAGVPAAPGDYVAYTVVITNDGDELAQEVELEAAPPDYTTLRAGTVTTTLGAVAQGNDPGDTSVLVLVGDLATGEEAVITFEVAIDSPLPAGVDEIAFQGTARAADDLTLLTDDPDTPAPDDPTRTPVAQGSGPSPLEIPTAGTLGLLILVALLGLAAIFRLRTATA